MLDWKGSDTASFQCIDIAVLFVLVWIVLDCFIAACLSAIYSPQARVRRGFVISISSLSIPRLSHLPMSFPIWGQWSRGREASPILSNVYSPD